MRAFVSVPQCFRHVGTCVQLTLTHVGGGGGGGGGARGEEETQRERGLDRVSVIHYY